MTEDTKDTGASGAGGSKPAPSAGMSAEISASAAPAQPQARTTEPEARIIEETIVKPPAPRSATPTDAPLLPKLSEAQTTPPAPVSLLTSQNPKSPKPPDETIVSHSIEELGKEKEHLASILQEIKLPERRSSSTEEKTAKQSAKVFDTALGTGLGKINERAPEAPAPEAPVSSALPAHESSDSSIVAPLRTLKNDLRDVVREKKISLVRAVALETEKRRDAANRELEHMQRYPHRHGEVLFTAALLIVVGGAALGGVYFIMSERSAAPSGTLDSSILFAESTVVVLLEGGSPLEFKRLLAQARTNSSATLGAITRVIPTIRETSADGAQTERDATLEEFLNALGARAGADLVRALASDFFFGIHTVDENAPLLVIPVLSYERAFAGMLAWEQTMNADLSPVFTAVPAQVIGPSGLPEGRRFEDIIMRNYDVRALKDDAGVIQLFYSFPTRSLLTIGESPYSFTEVLSRLRAERKL